MKLVSICVTTYNVGQYLRECLDSILIQNVDQFEIEIIVVDDCSTDDSPQILDDYYQRHPQLFKVYHNEVNLKCSLNNLKALSLCRGDYIAILDGDDYWTDKNKLIKQFNILESHPEVAFAHHNACCLHSDGTNSEFNKIKKESFYDLSHLLEDANIWNSSVMYRNIYQGNYPKWLLSCIAQDYPLHVLHAKYGQIYYDNAFLGVYRIHDSNTSRHKDMTGFLINCAEVVTVNLKLELDPKYWKLLDVMYSRLYDQAAGIYLKQHNFLLSFKCILRSYLKSPLRVLKEYKDSYYHIFK